MNRSLVLQRLCFKEFRMLMPLVLMLAVIGLILHILMLLSISSDLTSNTDNTRPGLKNVLCGLIEPANDQTTLAT